MKVVHLKISLNTENIIEYLGTLLYGQFRVLRCGKGPVWSGRGPQGGGQGVVDRNRR